MHRCLHVFDIVSIITDFVFALGDSTHDWRSVAALARTCKTFYEPALNTLWRTQIGIEYLIKCMPADAWEEHAYEHENFRINDWQRKIVSLASSS